MPANSMEILGRWPIVNLEVLADFEAPPDSGEDAHEEAVVPKVKFRLHLDIHINAKDRTELEDALSRPDQHMNNVWKVLDRPGSDVRERGTDHERDRAARTLKAAFAQLKRHRGTY
jgi:hypothetical protein